MINIPVRRVPHQQHAPHWFPGVTQLHPAVLPKGKEAEMCAGRLRGLRISAIGGMSNPEAQISCFLLSFPASVFKVQDLLSTVNIF